MRSHAAAMAWELRRHHGWGLTALGAYLLALAAFRLLILVGGLPLTTVGEGTFAVMVIVPVGTAFMYLLAVFSFGFSGDLAGRQSMYPARMFTLPVTSAALAWWPMLYGTACMVILWSAVRFLAVWPPDVEIPLAWPAILAAAVLAWAQALSWMPYALPGLRMILTLFLLVLIVVVGVLAFYLKASEPVMLAILAPNLLLAFLTARFGIARARRGDIPDLLRAFRWVGRIFDLLPRRQYRFASPNSAQLWFEWRCHGRSLPAVVAMLLPFELSLLYIFRDTPTYVGEILLAALMTPPFMAVFVAATAGRPNPEGRDSYGVRSLPATRPLTSAALIGAKLKAALWSTLATWLLVVAAIVLGLMFSGTMPLVIDWARRLSQVMGTPRVIAVGVLGISALLAATWAQLVQSLCIGLSGRERFIKGSILAALALLTTFVSLAHWALAVRAVMHWFWNALPWTCAAMVGIKTVAAGWVAVRLYDNQLLKDRTLIAGATGWTVVVLALYGLLGWLVSTTLIPGYFILLVAILAVPLVRLSASPLALARNRHGQLVGSSRMVASRRTVVGAVLGLVSVPAVLAVIAAVVFSAGHRNNGVMVSSGEEREFLLHVPRGYDSARPTPLVISLHGGAVWPAMQEKVSGWSRLADREQFMVVYPAGVRYAGPRAWRVRQGDGLEKDISFIADLIELLARDYNIDRTRIYAEGLSNGAGMAYALSCALSGRLAAVGMVAACHTLPWNWCEDQRPVPMIAFHGTADPITPYHGGKSWIVPETLPDIAAWTRNWAQRNRCRVEPAESVVAPDVIRYDYAGCGEGAEVVLYALQGGGHSWPGGAPLPEWFVGTTNRSIDATALMWEFFRRHQGVR